MLKRLLNTIIATTFILICTNPLIAQTSDNKLQVTFYGSFIHTQKIPNALFFFDKITADDSFYLRKALRNHDIDTVVLSSGGGSVFEGLQMAGIIHDRRLNTYIPKRGLSGSGVCASACAFMFFGGKNRKVSGELGVHQFYYQDGSEKVKVETIGRESQFTVSRILGFLNEFDTPRFVFEKMFQQSEMYYFNELEIKKLEMNEGEFSNEETGLIDVFIDDFMSELKRAVLAKKPAVLEKKPKPSPVKKGLDVSNRDRVRALQILLNDAKCSAGIADGIWGRRTNSAAKRFAKANRLNYSGPQSIENTFFDKFKSQDRRFCQPMPRQITPNWLSKQWTLNFTCKGKTTAGTASFSYRSSKSGQRLYGLKYTSRTGLIFIGTAKVSGHSFMFNAYEQGTKNNISGSGKFSTDQGRWRLSGIASGQCTLTGLA